MTDVTITEPANGAIVAWFKGRVPVAAYVRIDEYTEADSRESRWYNVDEERGFDEGPEKWSELCTRMGREPGPVLLTVGEPLPVGTGSDG